MKNFLLLFVAIIAASVTCSGSPTISEKLADKKIVARQKPKTQPTNSLKSIPAIAFVRVLHAVPDGSKIDVYDSALKIAEGLRFKEVSEYTKVKSGKSSLKALAGGHVPSVIATDEFSFTKGKHYTLVLSGKYKPTLLSINESNSKDTPEKSRLRVVHLAIGTSTLLVTIFSARNQTGFAKFFGKPLQYGKAASKKVDPEPIQLQIRTPGGKLLGETSQFTPDAGKRYSVFVVGDVNAAGTNHLSCLVKPAIK